MTGPLAGLRVLEFVGIGPGPFCGMLFADYGASVTRIDRPRTKASASAPGPSDRFDVLSRGKDAIVADLKNPDDRGRILDMAAEADILIEGYRPGVMERLGLGPETCLQRNPRLIYGRVTGWGQDGPLAHAAGHDINYLSITGALHAIGPASQPSPPLNLIADFGGGGMLLAVGILAALSHAQRTGVGQVVDAAMFEGANLLAAMIHGMRAEGAWRDAREANLLDGGSPDYGVYACADGLWLAAGPLEPQFFRAFSEKLGLPPEWEAQRRDPAHWPSMKARIAERFRTMPRDAWIRCFEGTDACLTPVLSWSEAANSPHALARRAFMEREGIVQPAPAPVFSATPCRDEGED